jgi:hypothetical protein
MSNIEEQELKDRLSLIENMIAEGRRGTESWGWVFVLWGVAYYVAILWSSTSFLGPIWGRQYLAWPVTMTLTCVLTIVIGTRKQGTRPSTTISRAIAAMWMAMGISMFVLLLSLGLSGRGDQQVFIAVIAAMLGTTNAASSFILRWKMQFACALVWWAAAGVSLFVNITQSSIVFLLAIFFCQIAFGVYGMIAEGRERKQGASHA